MMHLLHRTMPIIALAALVTVSPAGAQERDDSTSTVSNVGALLGMGARFMTLQAGTDDASSPADWNCAGGCRSFGARSLRIAPVSGAMAANRSSRRQSLLDAAGPERSLGERVDLSDYGWSRRVDADGSPLGPVNAVPVFSSPEGSVDQSSSKSTERPAAPVSRRQPDGAGQAPAWAALGKGNAELDRPAAPSSRWTNEVGDNADDNADDNVGESVKQGSSAATSAPVARRFAESFDQAAPLVTTVPEPSTVVLLAAGLSALVIVRRGRSRRR